MKLFEFVGGPEGWILLIPFAPVPTHLSRVNRSHPIYTVHTFLIFCLYLNLSPITKANDIRPLALSFPVDGIGLEAFIGPSLTPPLEALIGLPPITPQCDQDSL